MTNIFAVRGYMKSGTNWICNLIKLHPQLNCVGEFHWERITAEVIEMFEERGQIAKVEGLRDRTWKRLTELIRQTILEANFDANRPDLKWAGDRTPNFIHPSIFPGARFVNVIRDGRDVAVSKGFHLYNHPDISHIFQSDPNSLENLKQFQKNKDFFKSKPERLLACEEIFRDTVEIWKATVEHNEKTKADFPDVAIHDVKYEDAHADTESVRRGIYEFFEVDPDLAAELEEKTKPGFATEKPKSFFRKGSVGDWKNYFTDNNTKIFKEIAGQTLIELGYEKDLNW